MAALLPARETAVPMKRTPAERPTVDATGICPVSAAWTGQTGRSSRGAHRNRSPRSPRPGGSPMHDKEPTRDGHHPGRRRGLTAPLPRREPRNDTRARLPGQNPCPAGIPSRPTSPRSPLTRARRSLPNHRLRRPPQRRRRWRHRRPPSPRRLLPRLRRQGSRSRSPHRPHHLSWPRRLSRPRRLQQTSRESARRRARAVAPRRSGQPRTCVRRWREPSPAPRPRGRSCREDRTSRPPGTVRHRKSSRGPTTKVPLLGPAPPTLSRPSSHRRLSTPARGCTTPMTTSSEWPVHVPWPTRSRDGAATARRRRRSGCHLSKTGKLPTWERSRSRPGGRRTQPTRGPPRS